MKKYALLCVLMSMMSSAYAFEWVKVTEKEEFTMFIDPNFVCQCQTTNDIK
ncbi:MAG: hypothetical protein IKO56_02835 [Alphaproteobacteria bacterium]|nr:hypothetical protein [Alphaproteobacteria bacterium]